MTNLVVRKIGWEFDASVPFMWQPANPEFGLFCNAFTFIAVPFERYIVNVIRQAGDTLNEDADVAAEAEAFLRQEAQHASAHRKHMIALVQRYPDLEQCYVDACKAYDDLLAEKPIEFHAAYIANLEATFTPLFKTILDNRDSLFTGGDPRVASLMMWHFVEEIEHRSSGLIVYRKICPDPWYRTRQIRATFAHVAALADDIAGKFDEIVPIEDRGISTRKLLSTFFTRELGHRLPGRRTQDPTGKHVGSPTGKHVGSPTGKHVGSPTGKHVGSPTMFHGVPTSHLAKMFWRLALSQMPRHDPHDQPLPDWADTWMREYERGTDMTRFFGSTTAER